jgi:hypothetical protein
VGWSARGHLVSPFSWHFRPPAGCRVAWSRIPAVSRGSGSQDACYSPLSYFRFVGGSPRFPIQSVCSFFVPVLVSSTFFVGIPVGALASIFRPTRVDVIPLNVSVLWAGDGGVSSPAPVPVAEWHRLCPAGHLGGSPGHTSAQPFRFSS